ncbi:Golgi integral membrane protein 4-like isoform X2 [Mytilus californianus]|uniref:Golgi integral membrane protein 4-like isoform X2 n=1 Tax=Mytilus californianus TaxID=6549 RepID=UPI00224557B4|nr:Golgi integral membrane protein 4-like isoform X2 [Mytilus californianus]
MTRRNGSVAKIVAAAVFVVGAVYFFYVFNQTSGKLKDTERVANRYRREQEALSSQLADLRSEKENLQSRCDNERKEYQNRLSSSNQQYKMIQSQHEDLQSEFTRLRDDLKKDKDDHKLHDAQQNQEYMQLKQEKDLEISSLKDEVANTKRDKDSLNDQLTKLQADLDVSQKKKSLERKERLHLEIQVGSLKKQVNSYQMSVNTLQEQNKALETQFGLLKQSFEQQKLQQQQNLQQQNLQQQNLQQQNLQQQNLHQQQNQQHPVVDGNPVSNLKNIANQAIGNLPNAANQLAGNIKEAANSLGGGQNVEEMEQNKLQQQKDKEKDQEAKNKLIEEQQQQHQVAPPNKHENDDDKLDHKLQLQPGKTSKETPKPVSHGPNIKPPNFKRDGEKSEEKPDVPKVNDRMSDKDSVNHNQMPPPGGLLDILKKDKISGKNSEKLASNTYNKGELHPNELNQQQNIPPPNVGDGVHEKRPVVDGNVQELNIPPPDKMIVPNKKVVDVPKLFDDSKEDFKKQPALPQM